MKSHYMSDFGADKSVRMVPKSQQESFFSRCYWKLVSDNKCLRRMISVNCQVNLITYVNNLFVFTFIYVYIIQNT